jgi:transcriptional regulator with XRE-family HTH domain
MLMADEITDDERRIGARLAGAREGLGLTQTSLAINAGVSVSSVQRWESGRLPPIRELIRIAGILEIPPSELVEFEETTADHLAAIRVELAEIKAMLGRLL